MLRKVASICWMGALAGLLCLNTIACGNVNTPYDPNADTEETEDEKSENDHQ